jgi:hypothetical protein
MTNTNGTLSWRNWHTQRSQKPRPVRGCRFKSCREHLTTRACSSTRKSPCLPSRLLWVQLPSGTLDPVAQPEEPWTSNPQVAGPIPARVIRTDPVAQPEERRPPKPKAAGSNPAGITLHRNRSRGGTWYTHGLERAAPSGLQVQILPRALSPKSDPVA